MICRTVSVRYSQRILDWQEKSFFRGELPSVLPIFLGSFRNGEIRFYLHTVSDGRELRQMRLKGEQVFDIFKKRKTWLTHELWGMRY